MIPELIDKQDGFEIVRDKIGQILVTEIANQQILAVADSQDPNDWKLRIFLERSNAWEQFLGETVNDKSPIVNIWYESSNFEEGSSSVVDRQTAIGIFNIDCYGYGESQTDGGSGHLAGDELAAKETQKALRLVRNILMAGEYTYLDLRNFVWQRWPQSITVFQPEFEGQAVQNVVGSRIAFRVKFNEFAPQVTGEIIELISVDICNAENGELVVEADYEYPFQP